MHTVHGRQKLSASVDGQQVEGSSFPVSVSIHPTQLGKPVRVWTELNVPFDIASNTTGELIVAEVDGIVKIHKSGFKNTCEEVSVWTESPLQFSSVVLV